jgi:hypothetical protein
MHWEKIPLERRTLYPDGKYEKLDLIKEQLKDLKRQNIPFRFVRTMELDGTENISIEKQWNSKC